MTQTYKKKLIEVAIPLEAINAASAREKSIRHGHPSTLHMWWARRPLAACRAVLFAQLVDDPSSQPDKFPTDLAVEAERKRLFAIIEELVKWENTTNEEVLERARAEIVKSCDGELPSVYDPFSGGGSIPLEAQRLGLPAHGSDLNPIPVMIGKAMIEIPPKYKNMDPVHPGIRDRSFYRNVEGLAEDVKYYGQWMRDEAWSKIGHLYPKIKIPSNFGGGQGKVIAWIWARTVPSPDPAFHDCRVPLVSNFLLSTKKGSTTWIKPDVDKSRKKLTFDIISGDDSEAVSEAKQGTKSGRGANFKCLFSGAAITPNYVREMAVNGKMSQTIIAICVATKSGRVFVPATLDDEQLSKSQAANWLPDLKMNQKSKDLISGRGYGFKTWDQVFTSRQLVALTTFVDLAEQVREKIKADYENNSPEQDARSAENYSNAVGLYLSLCASKLSIFLNVFARWRAGETKTAPAFGRQALAMVWDFAEINPFAGAGGDFLGIVDGAQKTLEKLIPANTGCIEQKDAQFANYPANAVISSDPPYYDNIAYADLSDFFYIWLKPSLKNLFKDEFSSLATPKADELVALRYRHENAAEAERFFMHGMTAAIKNMNAQASDNFPATIYYAFKQSEVSQEGISSTGWAAFLQAVISAGYNIVGTWPLRTEMSTRLIASGTNALANSVVLVCRSQTEQAETITRGEFIRHLKKELPEALNELQKANVSPADMPQASIGPGIGVFSRFKSIIEADDSAMSVKTALQLINVELDEFLNDLHGDFDPETRFSITWFEQYGFGKGDYGLADSLARARAITVESVKHAGTIESSVGKVRILKRNELETNWDPNSDTHITIWECCQYLVREYEEGGETAAAMLIKKMGFERAEAVKDLTYYLYDVCANKRQDSKEATSYNALIAGWNDITRIAASIHDIDTTRQASLF